MFIDNSETIDELTETVSCYVNFCEEVVSEIKTITRYSNDKPWITKEIKQTIKEKHAAFSNGQLEDVKRVDGKLKSQIRKAKFDYKKQLENNFEKNNTKKAWDSVKEMIGWKKNSDGLNVSGDVK